MFIIDVFIVIIANKNNIEIIPIPGACAFVNALITSGLNTSNFKFIGFLPVNKTEKKEILENIKYETSTLIFYEAPHKLRNTLSTIYEELGDRQCCLAKEITKIHEKFIRGKLSEILEELEEPKGEFVIILEGNDKTKHEIEMEKQQRHLLLIYSI
mgnify:CR=1 FL=1